MARGMQAGMMMDCPMMEGGMMGKGGMGMMGGPGGMGMMGGGMMGKAPADDMMAKRMEMMEKRMDMMQMMMQGRHGHDAAEGGSGQAGQLNLLRRSANETPDRRTKLQGPGLRDGRQPPYGRLRKRNFQSKTYYFCAPECRDAFLADPQQYLHLHRQHGLQAKQPTT
jgi:hypothetical protein